MLHQTLTRRILCAATVLLLLCAAGAYASDDAFADVVRTRDGQWWPKKIREVVGDAQVPSDAVLKESGSNNLDLAYDKVKIGGVMLDAANVTDIWSTAAYKNAHFNNGDLQGQSGYWIEAAASFEEAAEGLKGAAKQIAMWQRVQCLRYGGKATKTFDAAQQLLEAFPKSYYFAPVQDLRARVLYMRGKRKDAKAALDKVISTPGMNARDYFEAKLAVVYLFGFKIAGRDTKKYAAARQRYEQILSEIGARSGATKQAAMQRLKALVGIGKCFVYEASYPKARTYFDQVIGDKSSLESKELLSQAYTGLGDVKYAGVKAELAAGNVEAAKLSAIQDRLTDAGLDYLRVAKHYVAEAGDELFPATVGVARVWATQFTLGGEKDCPLAMRATKFFYAADRMLKRGEQQRLLRTEVKAFLAKRNDACGVPGAAPKKKTPKKK